jgi:hypothetical protein
MTCIENIVPIKVLLPGRCRGKRGNQGNQHEENEECQYYPEYSPISETLIFKKFHDFDAAD